jgi:hypothetical protein
MTTPCLYQSPPPFIRPSSPFLLPAYYACLLLINLMLSVHPSTFLYLLLTHLLLGQWCWAPAVHFIWILGRVETDGHRSVSTRPTVRNVYHTSFYNENTALLHYIVAHNVFIMRLFSI